MHGIGSSLSNWYSFAQQVPYIHAIRRFIMFMKVYQGHSASLVHFIYWQLFLSVYAFSSWCRFHRWSFLCYTFQPNVCLSYFATTNFIFNLSRYWVMLGDLPISRHHSITLTKPGGYKLWSWCDFQNSCLMSTYSFEFIFLSSIISPYASLSDTPGYT
jgi:hypothetical protein